MFLYCLHFVPLHLKNAFSDTESNFFEKLVQKAPSSILRVNQIETRFLTTARSFELLVGWECCGNLQWFSPTTFFIHDVKEYDPSTLLLLALCSFEVNQLHGAFLGKLLLLLIVRYCIG